MRELTNAVLQAPPQRRRTSYELVAAMEVTHLACSAGGWGFGVGGFSGLAGYPSRWRPVSQTPSLAAPAACVCDWELYRWRMYVCVGACGPATWHTNRRRGGECAQLNNAAEVGDTAAVRRLLARADVDVNKRTVRRGCGAEGSACNGGGRQELHSSREASVRGRELYIPA